MSTETKLQICCVNLQPNNGRSLYLTGKFPQCVNLREKPNDRVSVRSVSCRVEESERQAQHTY